MKIIQLILILLMFSSCVMKTLYEQEDKNGEENSSTPENPELPGNTEEPEDPEDPQTNEDGILVFSFNWDSLISPVQNSFYLAVNDTAIRIERNQLYSDTLQLTPGEYKASIYNRINGYEVNGDYLFLNKKITAHARDTFHVFHSALENFTLEQGDTLQLKLTPLPRSRFLFTKITNTVFPLADCFINGAISRYHLGGKADLHAYDTLRYEFTDSCVIHIFDFKETNSLDSLYFNVILTRPADTLDLHYHQNVTDYFLDVPHSSMKKISLIIDPDKMKSGNILSY